jgi:predicted MFS family arabinose efflux permease
MGELFRDNRRLLIFIIISNFLLNFGFQIWQTVFNNFAVEQVHAGPAAIGLIQSVREIPGLLGFLLGFLAMIMSEIRIMSLSVILLGIGIVVTGQAQTVPFLLATTFLMSFGFHFFGPSSNGVVLMISKKLDVATTLGNLGSLGALAAVAGTAAVYFLAVPLGYRTLFMVVGVLVIVGGLMMLPFNGVKDDLPSGRKVTLRKRYWLYYVMAFLMGSRRHIFTTFAIFLLVREYHVNVQTTAMLFLVNSLVNTVTMRLTGQLVGKIGERLSLSITFGSLAFIFFGYAVVSQLWILFVLFVLDNIFFGFNIALTTYLQKIVVTKEEITSNLSVEQAIEHIAAIVVPVVGGTVWELYGRQAPFIFGVVIVLISLVLVQWMHVQRVPEPAAAI